MTMAQYPGTLPRRTAPSLHCLVGPDQRSARVPARARASAARVQWLARCERRRLYSGLAITVLINRRVSYRTMTTG